ncbi:MAG: M24 family metallopeptidase [Candidatus Kapabacteria bacterium]|nr:M24 family metallopeptidase [Candidatus Kapabacteria bacterium]
MAINSKSKGISPKVSSKPEPNKKQVSNIKNIKPEPQKVAAKSTSVIGSNNSKKNAPIPVSKKVNNAAIINPKSAIKAPIDKKDVKITKPVTQVSEKKPVVKVEVKPTKPVAKPVTKVPEKKPAVKVVVQATKPVSKTISKVTVKKPEAKVVVPAAKPVSKPVTKVPEKKPAIKVVVQATKPVSKPVTKVPEKKPEAKVVVPAAKPVSKPVVKVPEKKPVAKVEVPAAKPVSKPVTKVPEKKPAVKVVVQATKPVSKPVSKVPEKKPEAKVVVPAAKPVSKPLTKVPEKKPEAKVVVPAAKPVSKPVTKVPEKKPEAKVVVPAAKPVSKPISKVTEKNPEAKVVVPAAKPVSKPVVKVPEKKPVAKVEEKPIKPVAKNIEKKADVVLEDKPSKAATNATIKVQETQTKTKAKTETISQKTELKVSDNKKIEIPIQAEVQIPESKTGTKKIAKQDTIVEKIETPAIEIIEQEKIEPKKQKKGKIINDTVEIESPVSAEPQPIIEETIAPEINVETSLGSPSENIDPESEDKSEIKRETPKKVREPQSFVKLEQKMVSIDTTGTYSKIIDKRLEQLRFTAGELKVDTLVISYLPNIRYLTGFSGSAATLFIQNERIIIFTDDRYEEQVKTELFNLPNFEVHITRDVWDYGIRAGVFSTIESMAFEADKMPYSDAVDIRNFIRPIKFKPASNEVSRFMVPKAPEEVYFIQKAVDIALKVYEEILKFIQPGKTERDIATEISYLSRKYGSESDPFDIIVVSGERCGLVHGQPSDRKIRKGDIVIMDFGCTVNGFISDITRTIAIGKATKEQRALYQLLIEAKEAAIKIVKPGMNGKTVDNAARSLIQNAGFGDYFQHSLGHGIGLDAHEAPLLTFRKDDQIVSEDCCLAIEPGVYFPDKYGMRVEDNIQVTRQGAKYLSRAPEELVVIE